MGFVCCRKTAPCRHTFCELNHEEGERKRIFTELSFHPILRLSRKLRSDSIFGYKFNDNFLEYQTEMTDT